MVNPSKVRDPRSWAKWRASGAISSVRLVGPEGYLSPDGVLSLPKNNLPMSELEAHAEKCGVSPEIITARALGQYLMIRTEEQNFKERFGYDNVRTRVVIDLGLPPSIYDNLAVVVPQ